MDAKRLIELRKEAEKAVSEMPDGDLKLKAFEVILNHLITSSLSPPVAQPGAKKADKATVQVSDDFPSESVSGRVMVLKEEGFFKNPKSLAEIREELQAHGWRYPNTTLAPALIRLCGKKRVLRRERTREGKTKLWKYFNP
jgi:hypothetical protein